MIALAPASGYRNKTTGALTAVGTYGGYWSASPNAAGDANVGHLRFDSGYMNPLNGNPRTYGFTVRCVQYLQAAFLKEWFIFAPLKQLRPGISRATVFGSVAADSAIPLLRAGF